MRFSLGTATIHVFDIGTIRAHLRDWLDIKPGVIPELPDALDISMQCAHIAIGDASILVDAPCWMYGGGHEYSPPGYTPPPDLPTQLRTAGIDPAAITHVLITHAHHDHLNALVAQNGAIAFPNAWHYLGRADWDYAQTRKSEDAETTDTARILETLHAANILMRIGRDTQIVPGVMLLAAPGETPGHLIVRVASENRVLYCLGDLYHHPLEVAHNLAVRWADGAQKRSSRAGLAIAALHDTPLLMATHIPGLGQLQFDADSLAWVSVQR